MIGWTADIGNLAMENTDFRRVAATGRYSQLTFMDLKPGDDMGKEIHLGLDEFIHVRTGRAKLAIGLSADEIVETHELEHGWAAFVPGGYWYNITNIGADELKLYMLTAPPAHRHDAVYRTRDEAQMGEEREELEDKLVRGYAEAEGFGA
jgi:mannose-6-phosphate isomerase-like protein (cupin superfamily)